MLNAVIDTNVFVSGLLKGSTRSIIDAFIARKFNIFITDELLDELVFTLAKPRLSVLIPEADCSMLVKLLKERGRFVKTASEVTACRDIKDNKVLSCALDTDSFLVTGDKDILSMIPFKNVKIVTPSEFLNILANPS